MKKILFTSHTANFAKFNQPFIQDLRKKGHIVHYASADDEPVEGVDRHITIDFARSPYRLDKHLKAYRQLRPLIETEQYDLIHTHTPSGGVVTRLATKPLRRRQKRAQQKITPLIYTAHGFHFYHGAPLINWLMFYPIEKWLSRDTDMILTINHEDAALAEKHFQAGSVERLDGVGVNLTNFHPVNQATKSRLRKQHGYQNSDFILIYVAELNKNKDQEFVIKNTRELVKSIPSLRVVLVGEGAKRQKLEKLTTKLGLRKIVTFLGYRKDLNELYQMSDVVISASHREGLGLSVIEGMACGLPAVIRDNRGHREIISNPKIGYLFRTGTEFQAAVNELYQQPARRRQMGQAAAKSVEHFSLDHARAKMQAIYHKFLEK